MPTSSAEPVEYALNEVYAEANKHLAQPLKRAVHFQDGTAFDSSLLASEILRLGMAFKELNELIEQKK